MKKIIPFLTIIAFSFSCKSDEPTVADFDYKENSNGEFTFTNNSSGATSYEWDFGSGKTSTETNPKFTFEENKDFSVSLYAKGKTGQNQKTKSLKVTTAPDWAGNFAKTYSAVYWIVSGYSIEKSKKDVNSSLKSTILPSFTIKRIDKNTILIPKFVLGDFPVELQKITLISDKSFAIDETTSYPDGAKYRHIGTGKLSGNILEIYIDSDSGFGFAKTLIRATIL